MSFRERLSQFWSNVQESLFPTLEGILGELSADHKKLVTILELIRIEEFLPCTKFNFGRPQKHRSAIARAFVAKIIFKFTYTKQLVKQLKIDKKLAEICGFDRFEKIPDESKFSRAFKEFAEMKLPGKVHEALIKIYNENKILLHVVKDSFPLEVREKHLDKGSAAERKIIKMENSKKKVKGEELNRRQKQLQEKDLDKMFNDLPKACDKGMKKSAQGYTTQWKGYKLHSAVDDDCIPLTVFVSSASLNDCEVAIPLAIKSNQIATNLYDLMDAAYDHPEIKSHSISLGHVPIIDKCPHGVVQKIEKEEERKRKKLLNFKTAEDLRYNERFAKERFNALFKDYYGGKIIYYRGHEKVTCHVMFGVLTLAASLIINLIR
jgi:hypothetical protein